MVKIGEKAKDDKYFLPLRNRAKKLYQSLKPVKSSALGKKIYFPMNGFWHLIYPVKGRKARPRGEQVGKLLHIKHAYEIIKRSNTIQEMDTRKSKYFMRIKGGRKCVERETEYWGLIAIVKNKCVKVIIKQTGKKGNPHFWSVIPNWKVRKNKGKFARKMHKGNLEKN